MPFNMTSFPHIVRSFILACFLLVNTSVALTISTWQLSLSNSGKAASRVAVHVQQGNALCNFMRLLLWYNILALWLLLQVVAGKQDELLVDQGQT